MPRCSEFENKIFSWHKQKCCAYPDLGSNVLLPSSDIYQISDQFRYALIELSRIIRETLLDRLMLIDILSLNSYTVLKAKKMDNPQPQFF